jgi:transcriptional regulator with XRE-family HTH domain
MEATLMTFAEKVKQLRLQRGLTQATLADASGIPLPTLRDYEQGKRDPLLSNAKKLARALGVSIDELAPDNGPKAEGPPEPKKPRDRKGK